jgi:hypothetical protein
MEDKFTNINNCHQKDVGIIAAEKSGMPLTYMNLSSWHYSFKQNYYNDLFVILINGGLNKLNQINCSTVALFIKLHSNDDIFYTINLIFKFTQKIYLDLTPPVFTIIKNKCVYVSYEKQLMIDDVKVINYFDML